MEKMKERKIFAEEEMKEREVFAVEKRILEHKLHLEKRFEIEGQGAGGYLDLWISAFCIYCGSQRCRLCVLLRIDMRFLLSPKSQYSYYVLNRY